MADTTKIDGFEISLPGLMLEQSAYDAHKKRILAAIKTAKGSPKHGKHSKEWRTFRAICKLRGDDAKRQATLIKSLGGKVAALLALVKATPSEGGFAMANNCSGELARTLFSAAEKADGKANNCDVEQTATFAAVRSAGIAANRDKPGYNKGENHYGPQGSSSKGTGREQRSDDIASLFS